MGYRQDMRAFTGQLIYASAKRMPDAKFVIRQRYLLYPFVDDTDAYCNILRLKEYSIDMLEDVIANQTVYGSYRRVWRDRTDRHVCYDGEETKYYYTVGVACLVISAVLLVLLYKLSARAGLFHDTDWRKLCSRFYVAAPRSEPVATEDIEMAELDAGLK
jgi:hypothetical protein